MSFSWQFFEGGLLNLGTDYQLDISSSLVHLETDSSKHQRPFSAILDDIFLSDHLIYFGIDQSYNQSINLSTKPVVPQILMLDKIIGNPTLRYSVRYSWTNNVGAAILVTLSISISNRFPKKSGRRQLQRRLRLLLPIRLLERNQPTLGKRWIS
jgi:hypothetical protein